jgi:hypothetical protein
VAPPGTPRVPLGPVPKKSNRGCLVALGIVAAVLLLLLVVVGVVIHRAASSPEGRKVLGLVRGSARMVGESTTAPGTGELRALGCDSAMVMDMNSWLRVFGADGGVPRSAGQLDLFVICGTRFLKTPPSCERVAQTYVGAVGTARGSFQVMVQQPGRNRPLCAVCYDAGGTRRTCPRGAVTAAE